MEKQTKKNLLSAFQNFCARMVDCGPVKIKTFQEESSTSVFRLFGKTISLKKAHTPSPRNADKPFVYLKINRLEKYTLSCVQFWIDTLYQGGYDFCFICDNKLLEYEVLRGCKFPTENVVFRPSRRRSLKKTARNLCSIKLTANLTCAHLTPFFLAKESGIQKHWAIDADDTMFLMSPQKTAAMMHEVEETANQKNISALSLDMWYSKTFGRHWSLGVLYINDTAMFCDTFKNEHSMDWTQYYEKYASTFNLDWYMTYLKQQKNYNIESFYVNNCYFIHWGEFVLSPAFSWICLYKDNKIIFPLMDIFQNRDLSCFEIVDSIKLSVSMSEKESLQFFEHNISGIRHLPDKTKLLYGIEHYANP